jgi:hypothetical protein
MQPYLPLGALIVLLLWRPSLVGKLFRLLLERWYVVAGFVAFAWVTAWVARWLTG